MDNHIGLVFLCDAFGFSNGRILFSVLRRYAFVALATYRPSFFIRDHVLVPRPSSFALTRTFKEDLYQFNQNVYPRSGFVAIGHTAVT